jgi:hypothetical protein
MDADMAKPKLGNLRPVWERESEVSATTIAGRNANDPKLPNRDVPQSRRPLKRKRTTFTLLSSLEGVSIIDLKGLLPLLNWYILTRKLGNSNNPSHEV